MLIFLILHAASIPCSACSVCKVTINGKTWLGNNEDSWRIGSRIWFENKHFGKYGAVYVGYKDGFPQGGMNEAGLTFDGLTISPKLLKKNPQKISVNNPTEFIKGIMQHCATVEETRYYISKFNQPFSGGIIFFADKTGEYLIVEPDTLIIGNDSKYIIANFCPSSTNEDEKKKFDRYKRGQSFILNHLNDNYPDYCLALTDTMHECRAKVGDGTMYSFIADLEEGNLRLYFYHDFTQKKEFNLKNELAKGDHMMEIPSLFSKNQEYQKLIDYKTPQTNLSILLFLWYCGGIFAFSAVYFLYKYLTINKSIIQSKKSGSGATILMSFVCAMLFYYIIILIKNPPIFYFPSPYKDWKFSMLNIAAYIPFVLPIVLFLLFRYNVILFKEQNHDSLSTLLFSINNLTFLILILLFNYWKFYSIL